MVVAACAVVLGSSSGIVVHKSRNGGKTEIGMGLVEIRFEIVTKLAAFSTTMLNVSPIIEEKKLSDALEGIAQPRTLGAFGHRRTKVLGAVVWF